MVNNNLSRLEHYRHEYLTWERMLDFFKQENAFLKTRLSQVVDKKTDRDFLAYAEHFQNQFIIKDEFIEMRFNITFDNILRLFIHIGDVIVFSFFANHGGTQFSKVFL